MTSEKQKKSPKMQLVTKQTQRKNTGENDVPTNQKAAIDRRVLARAKAARRRMKRRLRALVIATLLAGLFGFGYHVAQSVLVGKVMIEGSTVYAGEQIQRAAGLENGQRLLLINTTRCETAVWTQLPYIESVRVTRHFPDTVRIRVEAARPYYRAQVGEREVAVSSSGRILGNAAFNENAQATPLFVADYSEVAVDGKEIVFASDKCAAIGMEILAQLDSYGMLPDTSIVGVENASEVYFVLRNGLEVRLGDSIELTSRLALAVECISRLQNRTGVLDASAGGRASFKPGRAELLREQPAAVSLSEDSYDAEAEMSAIKETEQ